MVPLPEYAGALEVLFGRTGDAENSARQRALLEMVDKLMTVNGEKANRTLALVYADAGRNLAKAVGLAKGEFEVRNDVYSYDALSWVLFKSGDLAEAVKASEKALALGMPEPSFYFHAGMIAAANGDTVGARSHLEGALVESALRRKECRCRENGLTGCRNALRAANDPGEIANGVRAWIGPHGILHHRTPIAPATFTNRTT